MEFESADLNGSWNTTVSATHDCTVCYCRPTETPQIHITHPQSYFTSQWWRRHMISYIFSLNCSSLDAWFWLSSLDVHMETVMLSILPLLKTGVSFQLSEFQNPGVKSVGLSRCIYILAPGSLILLCEIRWPGECYLTAAVSICVCVSNKEMAMPLP